ncbi:unnamed protein product [Gordionus sp. m RMFG-2023]
MLDNKKVKSIFSKKKSIDSHLSRFFYAWDDTLKSLNTIFEDINALNYLYNADNNQKFIKVDDHLDNNQKDPTIFNVMPSTSEKLYSKKINCKDDAFFIDDETKKCVKIMPISLFNDSNKYVFNSQNLQLIIGNKCLVNVSPCNSLPVNVTSSKSFLPLDNKYSKQWFEGVIDKIKFDKYDQPLFKIKISNFDEQRKLTVITTWLNASNLAYVSYPNSSLPIGTRIVSLHPKLSNKSARHGLKLATILESLGARNKNRYLVMFDDWVFTYVLPTNIYLIANFNKIDVMELWREIPTNAKYFVKMYLEKFPERALVHLRVGQKINVKCGNSWSAAQVIEIDVSLAKFYLEALDKYIWMYRGSFRLEPLYKEISLKNFKNVNRRRHSHVNRNKNSPYVEYSFINTAPLDENLYSNESSDCKIINIPKDTQVLHQNYVHNNIFDTCFSPQLISKNNYYVCNHECASLLGKELETKNRISKYCFSDLAKPLLVGWGRCFEDLCYYVTPSCDNPLHFRTKLYSIEEIFEFLIKTSNTTSTLTIDNFTFEPLFINVIELNRFPFFYDSRFTILNLDITEGKERVPISCLVQSTIKNTKLPNFIYDPKRIPSPGVTFDNGPSFLVGCDCSDGFCTDSKACACRSLTFESLKCAEKFLEVDDDSHKHTPSRTVGYNHKRLSNKVLTGIYECNPNCKCSHLHCSNRVVQNNIGGARLQIYLDPHKGWCCRTLDDIPNGAFVSNYSGYILTEEMSDYYGLQSPEADEYFADLDFIECAENGGASEIESDDGLFDDEEDLYVIWEEKKNRPVKNLGHLKALAKFKDMLDDYVESEQEIKITYSNVPESTDNIFQKKLTPEFSPLGDKITNTKNTRYFCSGQNGLYVLDAKRRGNVGRFYSHSCEPNMFVQNVFVDTHNLCFPWIAFFASTNIKAYEELTWDYGYQVNSTGKMIICKCGSENCRGRLL